MRWNLRRPRGDPLQKQILPHSPLPFLFPTALTNNPTKMESVKKPGGSTSHARHHGRSLSRHRERRLTVTDASGWLDPDFLTLSICLRVRPESSRRNLVSAPKAVYANASVGKIQNDHRAMAGASFGVCTETFSRATVRSSNHSVVSMQPTRKGRRSPPPRTWRGAPLPAPSFSTASSTITALPRKPATRTAALGRR